MLTSEPVCYEYDGSYFGFLTCVFECYVNHEKPAVFSCAKDPLLSLWPTREIETQPAHAQRVLRSLRDKMSAEAQDFVRRAFLTCLPEKELHLLAFIRLGYALGGAVLRHLTDPRVAVLMTAVRHLDREAHLLKGFTRFTEQEGILLAEISPKNWALPLLRPHFCARYPAERLAIYDKTHGEALFYEPRHWAIVPLDDFSIGAPNPEELAYRQTWRRFYDTIAIEGRLNPRCRMTHMPKRYWGNMTEFQSDGPQLDKAPCATGAQGALDGAPLELGAR